jgi:hypothetical protein
MFLFNDSLKKRIIALESEVEDLKKTIKDKDRALESQGSSLAVYKASSETFQKAWESGTMAIAQLRQENAAILDSINVQQKPSSDLEMILNDLLAKSNAA